MKWQHWKTFSFHQVTGRHFLELSFNCSFAMRFSAYIFDCVAINVHISFLNNKLKKSIGFGSSFNWVFKPGVPVNGAQNGGVSSPFQPNSESSLTSMSFRDWSKSISLTNSMLLFISLMSKPQIRPHRLNHETIAIKHQDFRRLHQCPPWVCFWQFLLIHIFTLVYNFSKKNFRDFKRTWDFDIYRFKLT